MLDVGSALPRRISATSLPFGVTGPGETKSPIISKESSGPSGGRRALSLSTARVLAHFAFSADALGAAATIPTRAELKSTWVNFMSKFVELRINRLKMAQIQRAKVVELER